MNYKISDSDKVYENFNEVKREVIESMLSCICDFRLEEWNEEHLLNDFEEVVEVFKCKEDIKEITIINNDILAFYGFNIECIPTKDDLLKDLMCFMADHKSVNDDFMKTYGYWQTHSDYYIISY